MGRCKCLDCQDAQEPPPYEERRVAVGDLESFTMAEFTTHYAGEAKAKWDEAAPAAYRRMDSKKWVLEPNSHNALGKA